MMLRFWLVLRLGLWRLLDRLMLGVLVLGLLKMLWLILSDSVILMYILMPRLLNMLLSLVWILMLGLWNRMLGIMTLRFLDMLRLSMGRLRLGTREPRLEILKLLILLVWARLRSRLRRWLMGLLRLLRLSLSQHRR